MIFKRESSFKELYCLNDMEISFTDDFYIWRLWYKIEHVCSPNRKSFFFAVTDEHKTIKLVYLPIYAN